MRNNFKFLISDLQNFGGGTIGRAPDSAQFCNRILNTVSSLIRTSTGGRENRDRTPETQFKITTGAWAGQALVILLVFISTATIITAAAVTVTIINARATGRLTQGQEALAVAEAGAENEILKLLRNPTYSGSLISEPAFSVGNGSATVTINGPLPNITITSTGTIGTFVRKIQVQGTFANDKFTLTSWQEIN